VLKQTLGYDVHTIGKTEAKSGERENPRPHAHAGQVKEQASAASVIAGHVAATCPTLP
jgi:hypothetical protein